MDIAKHTFLVTGGASGLGAACVTLLVERGARVLVADLDDAAGMAMAAIHQHAVRFRHTDVSNEIHVQAAVAEAVEFSDGDGLRGAIHCAGIAVGEKIVGKSGPHVLETFLKVLQVNLVGTFNVSRLAAWAMSQASPDANGERGVIVNTSSISAFEGQMGQAAYAASKGGVAAMTLPMARDLASSGVRVVAIAPGVFETPLVGHFPEKVQDALKSQTVFPPRLGRADEFAALALHAIENSMLNGCVLRLDGAVRLAAR